MKCDKLNGSIFLPEVFGYKYDVRVLGYQLIDFGHCLFLAELADGNSACENSFNVQFSGFETLANKLSLLVG